MKCDGTRAETRFRLSAKRTSPFKWARASVQSTTGSRGVRISGSNVGYTMFRGGVKGTGCLLHSLVSPSLLHPCVTVCHHVSTGLYLLRCFMPYQSYIMGRDSSVSIATRYGLDGPLIESRWGAARFSAPVQPGPGAHPASCTMGTGYLSRDRSAGAWRLPPTPI